MKITLLRHAQTEGNLRSAYIGRTDEPLSPAGVGVAAARAARAAAQNGAVKRVHTSALRRTRETAVFLYPHAEIVPHAELNEMHFGIFEGKNFRDLETDPDYAAWTASNCEAPCPDGESKEIFTRRCRKAFSEIVAEARAAGEEAIHFVVHGGTIMAVMSGFAASERGYFEWRADFCGGYVIEDAGPGSKRWETA